MNDRVLLERLAAEDAFQADVAMPSTAWEPEVAFAEVERLIRVDEETGPVTGLAAGSRRRGWLVTAAAFAAVLLIGVVAFLASRGDGRSPVATTTTSIAPTTTTAAPAGAPVPQEMQLVLDALERAYNRGDADAGAELVSTGAVVSLAPGVDPAVSPSAASLPERAATGAFYEERLRFEDCELFEDEVVCRVELTDEFASILDLEPWVQTWRIVVADGLVERVDVTGDDPVRAAAMTAFETFVAERTGEPDPGLLVDDLEWDRSPAGQAVYDEWVVLHTALANGVPEETFQTITEFHDAFNRGDLAAIDEVTTPGWVYRPLEAEDELSAAVYFDDTRPGVGRSDYFRLWYDWLQTDWQPIACSGDATTVICTVETSGLMTLILPGQVARGDLTYTLGDEGIVSVVDRIVRTGGPPSGTSLIGSSRMDLRGFWRTWMPVNQPEVELLWPGGNGPPPNGFDLELARAILEFYPQFLAGEAVAVPAEYLDGSLLEALPGG